MRTFLLLALVACGGSKEGDTPSSTASADTDTDTDVDTDTDTDVDTDTGTAPVGPEASEVTVTVAPTMGTVATVSWSQSYDSEGYVAFGEAGDLSRSTLPLTSTGGASAAQLVALPPETDIDYDIVLDGVVAASGTFTTGALPFEAPALTVEGSHDRFLALPVIDDDVSTATILDPQGRVVWMHEDTRGLAIFRTHVARDGSGIVYTASLEGGLPNEGSVFVKVPWDGSAEEVIPVPNLAHDFVELADGTFVSLAYEWRDDIEGNKLVALHPDGSTEDLWSAWDCYDPAVNLSIDLDHGWIHANALDLAADESAFYVGMRNLTTIARVEANDGTCTWGFGGSGGTVAIDGPTFYHQHQFTRFDGGMLVFDNDGAPGNESRVLEYAFDDVAGTAEHVRTISADPPLYSFILGDAHRLDDGDTMITWSVPATVDRMTADDTRVFRVVADEARLTFGFTQVMPDPGRPDLGISR